MISADFFSRLLHQPELLSEVSAEELEQLSNQYPWFGTAHLLLAAKMKQTGHISTHQQEQKAALYFNHTLFFNQELKSFSALVNDKAVSLISSPNFTDEDRLIDETDAVLDAEALIEMETLAEEEHSPVSDAVLDAQILVEAETLREELDAAVNDSVLDAGILVNAENDKEDQYHFIEKEAQTEATESTIAEPVAAKPEPLLTFEPYHTVDYFASQGIRLQEDKFGNDRLGQQVKSFTQWLKSMKKIYVEEQQELNASEEKAVVSKASESNQREEVVTEAMAGVLVKQGKLPQAIELYNKLSLLHPEKSAYFAALIKELNS